LVVPSICLLMHAFDGILIVPSICLLMHAFDGTARGVV
jgi:hypothetical protein